MGFLDKINSDWQRRASGAAPAPAGVIAAPQPSQRRPKNPMTAGSPNAPNPPGGFNFGTPYYGGPNFTDAFTAKRAPSPWGLVENWKGISYAMVSRLMDAVADNPLRMYVDASRKIPGARSGAPRDLCDPIKVATRSAESHSRANKISPAAVNQIYEIRNHPFLDVLDNPDPYNSFSRKKLIALLVAYQMVIGQAILVPEGNGWDWKDRDQKARKGPPRYLWMVYSQYTTMYRSGGTQIPQAFQYFQAYLPLQACIWFRHRYSLKDPYAASYSPLYAGDQYRSQEEEFVSIYNQIYELGPRPSLLATAKDPENPPGDIERRRFEQDMQRRQAAGNAGNLLVNNGAWDITPLSYSPTDMGGKDLCEYDRNNLACVMGLPPTYFTTDTNIANLQAADAHFARFGVEPMCSSIADTLTQIAKMFDPRLYFQFDPVLADDEMVSAQIDDVRLRNGSTVINIINEEKGIPKVPWGDEPLIDKNMAPLSLIVKQVEQSLQQTQATIDSQKKRDEFELQEPQESDEQVAAASQKGNDASAEIRALILKSREVQGQIQRRLSA